MTIIDKLKLEVTHVSIDLLKPYKNNARTHSKKQVQQIANSIKEFGFNVPILIDENYQIIAGHGRLEAAKKLGLKELPIILVEHLTEPQKKAFIIADNKITDNAGWDMGMLSIELQEIISFESNFDIEITGFETAEIDIIIDGEVAEDDPADEIPEVDAGNIVTKPGDLWCLGSNVLYCGDARNTESYATVLGSKKADMIFTDPPYNVKIDGHVCGNGKTKHPEFAMGSGEMSEPQFGQFVKTGCEHMVKYSKNGSLHYICMDWRGIATLINAAKPVYTELKNICVWNKDNGGMGSLYRSKHEFVAVFKHGTAPHTNNIELGKYGRYRTNIWDYKGVNSFGKNQADLKMHPTVKPVAMIADAIKDCTKRGQIILDPFAGSGSTLIAAEKTGRIAHCIELEPKYCDVIIQRWQKLTGKEAYNLDSFTSFNELNTNI
jgi:DNA modification methylase